LPGGGSLLVRLHRTKTIRNRTSIPLAALVALSLAAVLLPLCAAAVEPRVALVIGNSSYQSGPLINPANDARLIAETLGQLGFDVIERRNADQIAMKRAIEEFGARLEKAGPNAVGLFYYAGHGVQLSGRNYLIPTTANIEREGDVEIESVSADWVIEQMRYARNRLNIVILDACRNNPFTRGLRSAEHGLASMDAPAGILIAYSTAPGSVAQDGTGRNSPYTTALTSAMLKLNQPLEQVFKHVRVDVMAATDGKQVPWESSSLTGDFYFPVDGAAPASVRLAPAIPAATAPASAPPASGWTSEFSTWVGDLFSSHPAPVTAAAPAPVARAAAPVASISGARAFDLFRELGIETTQLDPARSYPLSTIRQVLETAPRRVTLGSTTEQIRSALALCSRYSRGCQVQDYADETLRHVLLQPYDLEAAPVSVSAFRQFADAAHYRTEAERIGFAFAMQPGNANQEERVRGGSWRNALKRRTVEEDAAVVGVSFNDALAYCQAKSERLPSEDEWEYAARGPQGSIFPWGNDYTPTARSLNIAPSVTDGPQEGIAGEFKGLSGNVWQWVDTLGIKTERGATRVLKGGSWLEANPANRRAATRRYEVPERADEDSGFRCAKSVATWPDAGYWLTQLQHP
jgi:formylglycine-generating enzyme required for sulfatase activity